MDFIKEFEEECTTRINSYADNVELQQATKLFLDTSNNAKYSYNFSWLGRPIIQYPQDMIAMQEIIWNVKPDLIIETGVAHGGSIIFYASMLELLGGTGQVIGIDIDIRKHNREAIEQHHMFKRIKLVEGSSTAENVVDEINALARGKKVLVCLDSMHTHEHVYNELNVYAPFVAIGSYCVVFDTFIEDRPISSFPDRPWTKGYNPKTAVYEFLSKNDNFEIDKSIQNKLLITCAPDGYLRRIK